MKIQVATRLPLPAPVSTRTGFPEDKLCGSDKREENSNRISIEEASWPYSKFFNIKTKL
ncbi:MAG: hypothetical protein OXJ52_09625 [Oligoflexia bacterium]|nr:hypothetical protein [Oligoflexia bacterium]